jgi:hypothetical protein
VPRYRRFKPLPRIATGFSTGRSHNAAASAGRQGYGKKHRLTLLAGCRRSADNLNAIEESVVGGVDNYVSSIRDDRKREPTFRVGPDCGPNRATVIVIE